MDGMSKGEFQDNVAGAPGTLEIGDKTFVVNPPTDKDMREIAKFLRKGTKSAVGMISEQIRSGIIPVEVRAEAIKAAVETDAGGGAMPTGALAFDRMNSTEGVRFRLWVCARKLQPGLQLKDLESLVTEENCDQVNEDLDRATGMAGLGNSPGRPGSSTKVT